MRCPGKPDRKKRNPNEAEEGKEKGKPGRETLPVPESAGSRKDSPLFPLLEELGIPPEDVWQALEEGGYL